MSAIRLLASAALIACAALSTAPAHAAGGTLYSFQGGDDGVQPNGGLLMSGGTIYGTTAQGGVMSACFDAGCGIVFAINAVTGVKTTLYSFQGGVDGEDIQGALIQYDNVLYGTTMHGGTNGTGTIYKLDLQTKTHTVLYNFLSDSDGAAPLAPLLYKDGALYGVTLGGGGTGCQQNLGCGTVFEIDATTGAEAVVYRFQGGSEGYYPSSGLTYQNGILYGETGEVGRISTCGGQGCGTFFSIDPVTGVKKILYMFGNNQSDGVLPTGNMIAENGILYGTTCGGGGPKGLGTVFAFDTSTNKETVLYSFQNKNIDGDCPAAPLVYSNGLLYGTAQDGYELSQHSKTVADGRNFLGRSGHGSRKYIA